MLKYILFFTIIIINVLFCSVDEYISRIQAFLGDGEYLKANEEFELAIKEYDANAKLYFVGAQISIKMDDLVQANKYFNKAIEIDDNKGYRAAQEKLEELKKLLTSARKTLDNRNIDGAILEYHKILEQYPDNATVYFNIGQAHKYNKEYDSAYDNFYKASILNKFKNDYKKAINEIAQRVAKQGNDEYRRKEYATAIEYFDKAVRFSPTFTKAYFKLAHSYYLMGDYENAQTTLLKNLDIDTQQSQSEKLLGDIYKKTNYKAKSIESYKRAVSIDSNYHQAYYSLGELYFTLSDLEKAKISLNNAIIIEPTYLKAIVTLGAVEQELGNYDIAIQNYEKALALDPRLNDVFFRLSRIYNIQEKYNEAKIAAKKSLRIHSQYSPAYFELGFAEMKLCNIVASKDAFEKAKRDLLFRKDAKKYLDNMTYYTKDCN